MQELAPQGVRRRGGCHQEGICAHKTCTAKVQASSSWEWIKTKLNHHETLTGIQRANNCVTSAALPAHLHSCSDCRIRHVRPPYNSFRLGSQQEHALQL